MSKFWIIKTLNFHYVTEISLPMLSSARHLLEDWSSESLFLLPSSGSVFPNLLLLKTIQRVKWDTLLRKPSVKVLKECQTLLIFSVEGQLQYWTLQPVIGHLLLNSGDAKLYQSFGENFCINCAQLAVNLHLGWIQLIVLDHRGQDLTNAIQSQFISISYNYLAILCLKIDLPHFLSTFQDHVRINLLLF